MESMTSSKIAGHSLTRDMLADGSLCDAAPVETPCIVTQDLSQIAGRILDGGTKASELPPPDTEWWKSIPNIRDVVSSYPGYSSS